MVSESLVQYSTAVASNSSLSSVDIYFSSIPPQSKMAAIRTSLYSNSVHHYFNISVTHSRSRRASGSSFSVLTRQTLQQEERIGSEPLNPEPSLSLRERAAALQTDRFHFAHVMVI